MLALRLFAAACALTLTLGFTCPGGDDDDESHALLCPGDNDGEESACPGDDDDDESAVG